MIINAAAIVATAAAGPNQEWERKPKVTWACPREQKATDRLIRCGGLQFSSWRKSASSRDSVGHCDAFNGVLSGAFRLPDSNTGAGGVALPWTGVAANKVPAG